MVSNNKHTPTVTTNTNTNTNCKSFFSLQSNQLKPNLIFKSNQILFSIPIDEVYLKTTTTKKKKSITRKTSAISYDNDYDNDDIITPNDHKSSIDSLLNFNNFDYIINTTTNSNSSLSNKKISSMFIDNWKKSMSSLKVKASYQLINDLQTSGIGFDVYMYIDQQRRIICSRLDKSSSLTNKNKDSII